MQVQDIQAQLMMIDEQASETRSAATETQRLTEENALLANQLRQMELNLKVPSFCLPEIFHLPFPPLPHAVQSQLCSATQLPKMELSLNVFSLCSLSIPTTAGAAWASRTQ